MRRALDELSIEGIQTTIPLHRRVFRNADFVENRVDTTWVERVLMPPRATPTSRGLSPARPIPPRRLPLSRPPPGSYTG